jgi:hypothetical protein
MLATDYQYLQDNASGVAEYMEEQMRLSIDHPTMAAPPILDLITVHRTGRRGRPRLEINPNFLESALELRGPSQIGRPFLNMSGRTIRRRAIDYGLRAPGLPIVVHQHDEAGEVQTLYRGRQPQQLQISEGELDRHVREALVLFPEIGRSLIDGYLKLQGIQVPRARIRASFLRVNGAPAEFGRRRIERRVYSVPGPNSLWHHDGHHSGPFPFSKCSELK